MLTYKLKIIQRGTPALAGQRWLMLRTMVQRYSPFLPQTLTTTEIYFTDGPTALDAFNRAQKKRKPGEEIELTSHSLIASEG